MTKIFFFFFFGNETNNGDMTDQLTTINLWFFFLDK